MRTDANIIIGTSVDVGGINEGLKKINKSFTKLGTAAASTAFGISGLIKLGISAVNASSDLVEVQNVVDVAFGDMSYKIEQFAETCVDKFGISEYAAKNTAGSFMAMGNAMGFSSEEASDMAVALTAASSGMASFYNISQDYARVALSAVYTGETETMKRYGIILTEANLQEYALSRGITTKVKAMDASSKAALRYNYVMSILTKGLEEQNDILHDFQRTQDSWANQIRLLQETWRQFLTVLGNGLTTILAPVLSTLRSIVVTLMQLTSALWSLLGLNFNKELSNIGSSASSAADSNKDLANSITAVGKAAKKTLSPLDEIHQFNKKKDSSGSGDLSDIVGIDPIDLSALFDGLKNQEKLLFDTFYDFGRYIGDTIAKALGSINWEKIKSKALEIGTNIGDMFNGIVDSDFIESIGRTIGEGLNAAIYFAFSLVETIHWDKFGIDIANGINESFDTFDFETLGQAINGWVTGLTTALHNTLANIEWTDVFSAIGDFFKGLGIDGVASLLELAVLKGLIKLALSHTISEAFIKGITKGLGDVTFKGLITGLGEKFGISLAGLAKNIGTNVVVIFATFKTAVVGFFTAIANVVAPFVPLIGSLVGIFGGVLLAASAFVSQLLNGFDMLKAVLTVIGTTLVGIGLVFAGLASWPAIIIAAVVGLVLEIVVLIKDNFEAVKEIAKSVGDYIGGVIYNVISVLIEWLDIMFTGLQDAIFGIMNIIDTVGDFILSIIFNFLDAARTGVIITVNAVVHIIQGLWNAILEGGRITFNTLAGLIERFLNRVIDGINVLLSGFSNLAKWAGSKLGYDWGGLRTIPNVTFPRLAKGAVIPPNKEFMAVLGDQKHGTNIEAPADLIRQIIREEIGGQQQGGEYRFIAQINRRTLFDEIIAEARLRQTVTGQNAFEL